MQRARYLSEAWLDLHLQAASEWPERLGVDCTANFEISEAPVDADALTGPGALTGADVATGRVRYHMVVRNGRLAEVAAGKLAGADVSIGYKYSDARAEVAAGDHPDLAYMTGRMKLDGDYARWVFGLRPLLDSEEHEIYRLVLVQHTYF